MRLTIDIPDEIHARLKAQAKLEGTTMRAFVLRGIESVLRQNAVHTPGKRKRLFRSPIIRSKRPGSLKLGPEGVYEWIDFP